ncbi:hypothetical protein EC847_1453 [Scandinavium goeteborgense]|uniref:Uncharacterized protein n=1 Tax=Scandinavium goeteborgense TaxID=1851514 RepID=A0A4R6DMX5_SCAGO|nr:hypothetical protein EC847_1453 [Scandinavium goeteborgense]
MFSPVQITRQVQPASEGAQKIKRMQGRWQQRG